MRPAAPLGAQREQGPPRLPTDGRALGGSQQPANPKGNQGCVSIFPRPRGFPCFCGDINERSTQMEGGTTGTRQRDRRGPGKGTEWLTGKPQAVSQVHTSRGSRPTRLELGAGSFPTAHALCDLLSCPAAGSHLLGVPHTGPDPSTSLRRQEASPSTEPTAEPQELTRPPPAPSAGEGSPRAPPTNLPGRQGDGRAGAVSTGGLPTQRSALPQPLSLDFVPTQPNQAPPAVP